MGNQGKQSMWVTRGNLCFYESRTVRAIRAIKTISAFIEIRATQKVLTIKAILAIRETRAVMKIRSIKAISAISCFLGLSQSSIQNTSLFYRLSKSDLEHLQTNPECV